MKLSAVNWHGSSGSERIRRILVTGRTFAVLSIFSALFFIAAGIGVIANNSIASSPASSMKGFAAAVSSAFFSDMLGMEMASFKGSEPAGALSGQKTAAFLVRLLTDVNPTDPKSLIARELPGLGTDGALLLRSGIATDEAVGPQDDQPIPVPGGGDEHGGGGDTGDGSVGDEMPSIDDPIPADSPDNQTGDSGDQGKGQGPATGDESAKPTTEGRKVIFIYHSHNRESWKPELTGDEKNPNSSTINVTLVGKRLAKKLEENGIGALHSGKDYLSTINNYRWELSYKYSMATVKEAMKNDGDLKFFFDIHRDSQPRKETTATIAGQSYAQVYFIIGHRNPDWRQNEAFATQIHEALEKKYPGISRGIWGKTAASGNGEYNQSLSPDSILMEIGGIDNTLEESYRTADALAEVITGIYWNAEKVDVKSSQ
jgi:stage II sporulation protein P